MKSSKVLTKDNKIIRKNQNLFEECGKKLYFYIDSSVNRSEYRRLDTLIEKNGGINCDEHCEEAINLTNLQTIYHPKNKDKNYDFYDIKFIYDSVENHCLQDLKDYRVPVFQDEDDTITSSMTNNQVVNEKSISMINKQHDTKSKEKLYQPVDSNDDEPSDIAIDQVSSTQSGCSIPNNSLESTPIIQLEPHLDEDLSREARLVINPFFAIKNKQAVNNNKRCKIKKEIDDEDSKQPDLDITMYSGAISKQPQNSTNNLLSQPNETSRTDVKFTVKTEPQDIDCYKYVKQPKNSTNNLSSQPNETSRTDVKFTVKTELQDIDCYKFDNDNFGRSQVNETPLEELNEIPESLDLLNIKNNREKKLLVIPESSDDEYDSIDNKENTDVKIEINLSDYKDNIDTDDTPENKFSDSINEMSIEEVHSPDLFGSPVCSNEKLSQTKQENNTSKQSSTDEDPSVYSDSQDENKTSKIFVKKDKSITKNKLDYLLSTDDEIDEFISTKKTINYHKNIEAKISTENEKIKIVAKDNKSPLSICLSPKTSNQKNSQDSNSQSPPKCVQQKKEIKERLNEPQRMIGNRPARVVGLPLSSSSSEDDDNADSTSTKLARYSNRKKSRQCYTKSYSSSDNDDKSKKSNSPSGKSAKVSSDSDDEYKPCSSRIKKSTSNESVGSTSDSDDSSKQKYIKKSTAWLDGTKLCFSTDLMKKRMPPRRGNKREYAKWEQNEMIRFVYDNDKFRHSRSKAFWRKLSATELFSHRTAESLSSHWMRTMLKPEYIENSELPKPIKDSFLRDSEYRRLRATYDNTN